MKLSSEKLNDVVIESLVLSVLLLEKLETMHDNNLFVTKTKQTVKNTISILENYESRLIKAKDEEEINHFKKASSVIAEISSRVEKALGCENVLDISIRKKYLKEIIEKTVLFPDQKQELYESIRDSGILDY